MPSPPTAAVQMQANQAAARIDTRKVGFPGLDIASIIAMLLPELIRCLFQNDPVSSAADVQPRMNAMKAKDPKRLRSRVATFYWFKSPNRLTSKQAYAIADAVIDQTIMGDAAGIMSAVNDCVYSATMPELEDE